MSALLYATIENWKKRALEAEAVIGSLNERCATYERQAHALATRSSPEWQPIEREDIARIAFEAAIFGDDEDVCGSWAELQDRISTEDATASRRELEANRDWFYRIADAVMARLNAPEQNRRD